jgi:hypothetical protein
LSTEACAASAVAARRAGAVAVAAWLGVAARAAEVDFHPVLTFGLFHDGNIAVIGQGAGDDGALAALDLAWDRTTELSTFAFSWRPSYVAYRRAQELGYFSNTLSFDYKKEWSHGSLLTVDLYAARTDFQPQTVQTADIATTYVPRTTLTHADLRIGGTIDFGPRGFVDWQVRGGADLYDDIKDNPATPLVETQNFDNAIAAGGRFAWRYELSSRNTLGLGLDFTTFGYELAPRVISEWLGLVGTCEMSRLWKLDYSAGATRALANGVLIDAASLSANVAYTAGEATTFGAGLRQEFAPGTGIGGATQDRGAWISVARVPPARGLSGSFVSGYWLRDALAFEPAGSATAPLDDSAALTINSAIGWTFNRYLAIDAAYVFVDQKARNGASAALDTQYGSYALRLRWAMNGRWE